jgi:lysyl-tRNA synthetase class 2
MIVLKGGGMISQPWATLPDRLPRLRRRARLTQAVRAFFSARGYLEVETPYLVPVPGEEVHLRAIKADGKWLHTSPEFAMKMLLAGGAGPIFQIARVWRDEPASPTHVAEFSMLEWYSLNPSMDALIEETFALLRAVLPPHITAQGYERLTVADAFWIHAGADLLGTAGDAEALAESAKAALRPDETWEDLFFRLLLERIEPHLGVKKPTFLTHWPAAQAALARKDSNDPRVAERFELYAGGMELANAFVELTDPVEQRARFCSDRARRQALYGPDWALDEVFLAALAQMPPCAGIAMGFDRLAMLATGAKRITDVLWL